MSPGLDLIFSMKNRIAFIVGGLAILVAAGIFVWRHDKIVDSLPLSELTDTRVTVAATFYPLAYFAEQVGGDRIVVINATPNGVEPHDYEPSPRELAKVGEANILLINGAGLDPWAEKASVEWRKNGQQVLVMSEVLEILPMPPEEEHAEDETHGEDAHEHEHGAYDPHFWLDPVRARQIVGVIRDTLINKDPINADVYRQNALVAMDRLSKLDDDYKTGLASCAQREIVAAHDAYNYLAKRYNLELHAIAGLSPEAEPSARRLADLADLIKAQGIKTIFFETLVSPKLANTLAQETGAGTAVLNPIEGLTPDQAAEGQDYDILMRENLAQLRLALVCQ